jgi:hypothetical protein
MANPNYAGSSNSLQRNMQPALYDANPTSPNTTHGNFGAANIIDLRYMKEVH